MALTITRLNNTDNRVTSEHGTNQIADNKIILLLDLVPGETQITQEQENRTRTLTAAKLKNDYSNGNAWSW